MARQTINVGATPNDGTGESLRDAGIKINDNFLEVYSYLSNYSTAIAILQGEVQTNQTNISSLNAATGSISTIQANVTTLQSSVATNTSNITTLQTNLTNLTNTVNGLAAIPNLTAVTSNIVPTTNNIHTLGGTLNNWKNVYSDILTAATSVQVGGATISSLGTAITLPALSTIPGVVEYNARPDTITKPIPGDPINDPLYYTAFPNIVIIDALTHAKAFDAANAGQSTYTDGFTPSVYTPTVDVNGFIQSIAITTSNYYVVGDNGATVNQGEMYACDPGTDINDPSSIQAASTVVLLNANVQSVLGCVNTTPYIDIAADSVTADQLLFNPLSTAPANPVMGLVAFSDGTWGSGIGLHQYDGTAWVQL